MLLLVSWIWFNTCSKYILRYLYCTSIIACFKFKILFTFKVMAKLNTPAFDILHTHSLLPCLNTTHLEYKLNDGSLHTRLDCESLWVKWFTNSTLCIISNISRDFAKTFNEALY